MVLQRLVSSFISLYNSQYSAGSRHTFFLLFLDFSTRFPSSSPFLLIPLSVILFCIFSCGCFLLAFRSQLQCCLQREAFLTSSLNLPVPSLLPFSVSCAAPWHLSCWLTCLHYISSWQDVGTVISRSHLCLFAAVSLLLRRVLGIQ